MLRPFEEFYWITLAFPYLSLSLMLSKVIELKIFSSLVKYCLGTAQGNVVNLRSKTMFVALSHVEQNILCNFLVQ